MHSFCFTGARIFFTPNTIPESLKWYVWTTIPVRIAQFSAIIYLTFLGQEFINDSKERRRRVVGPAWFFVNCVFALCLIVFGYKLWKLRKTAQISDASTPTSVPQGIQMEHQADPTIQEILNVPVVQDEHLCCICLEVLPLDQNVRINLSCCGKCLHITCNEKYRRTSAHCALCRAELPSTNKEHIVNLLVWLDAGKAWAQTVCSQVNF